MHQKLEGRRAIVRLTEDDDRGVVPEPLHILLRFDFHRLREGVVRRVLPEVSLCIRLPRGGGSPARSRT